MLTATCKDLTEDFLSLVSSLKSRPDLEVPPARDKKRILRKRPR